MRNLKRAQMRNVKETQCLEPRVNTFRRKVSREMGADACARLPVSSVNMKNIFFSLMFLVEDGVTFATSF